MRRLWIDASPQGIQPFCLGNLHFQSLHVLTHLTTYYDILLPLSTYTVYKIMGKDKN